MAPLPGYKVGRVIGKCAKRGPETPILKTTTEYVRCTQYKPQMDDLLIFQNWHAKLMT